jgi:hypothetical protein
MRRHCEAQKRRSNSLTLGLGKQTGFLRFDRNDGAFEMNVLKTLSNSIVVNGLRTGNR